MLRNILTREVPELAALHGLRVLKQVLGSASLHRDHIGTWIMHAGGRDVLQAVEKRFELTPKDLQYSAAILPRLWQSVERLCLLRT
ncbi:MAG: hypothetical protein WDM77_14875 [Steroidobacteraceae bacterium]